MNQYIIKGQKFNRLTAIERVFAVDKRNSRWLFKCDCGISKVILANNVKRGLTKSCGCFHREVVKTKITHGYIQKYKHGTNNPRFYAIWSGLRNRCQNKQSSSYFRYGGKGIKVEKRWNVFANFYIDMHESYLEACNKYGEHTVSIDRIDNSGNYSRKNCRWANYKIQSRNKTNNSIYLVGSKNMCIAEIVEKYEINKSKLYRRLKKGMTMDIIIKELAGTNKLLVDVTDKVEYPVSNDKPTF